MGQEYVVEKQIGRLPYWLRFHSVWYEWVENIDDATMFSTEETAQEFLECMTDEKVYLSPYRHIVNV